VIARCTGEDDVVAVVRAAREHGLPVSVRGGGHDWAGRALCDGGVVADLTAMRDVTVTTAGTAVAGGGATAGDVVSAARPYGLVPVTGTVKGVGLAGLTLAGGYGPLTGRYGLALDNLLSARVVLADGRAVTASAEQHPDLFWALRGGGGTLGVVTQAVYRLRPLDSVLAGLLVFPLYEAAAVLRGYREVIAGAPDELTLMTGFFTGAEGPAVFLSPTWSGPAEQGEKLIGQLRGLATPEVSQIAPMAYEDALGIFDSLVVNGRHYSLRTRWLPSLTEESSQVLTEAAATFTSPFTAIAVHHFHGAATRVGVQDTAFALRQDHLMVEVVTAWPADDAAGPGHQWWADEVSGKLIPHALPGGYPNLLGIDDRNRTALAYGPNLPRLREIRRRTDPDGVFSSAVGGTGDL
jgi:FAD/FMN-containing dehydrogenase